MRSPFNIRVVDVRKCFEMEVNLTAEDVKTIGRILHLDNFRDDVAISERNESDMAKDRRNVIIAWQEDGTPIIKDVRGNTYDEVNLKIATALIESGRMDKVIAKRFKIMDINRKPECKVTLSEYAGKYINLFLKGSVRESSLNLYMKYKKTIDAGIGKELLTNVTTETLQRFFNDHSDMCESTLKKMRGFMSPIFEYAVEEGIIERNPITKRLRINGTPEQSPDALSLEDLKKVIGILEELPDRHRRILSILLYAGLRRGEMLGLQWRDFDIANNVIHIRRQIKHNGNTAVVDNDLKTANGRRDIPLTDGMRKLLDLKGNDPDTYFVVSGAEPLTQKMYNNAWQHTIGKKIKEVTGLKTVTAHQLRHTYLTHLEGTGIDPKTLSAIAGHSDVAFTLKRYVGVQPNKIVEAGRRIDNVMQGEKSAGQTAS